MRRFFSHCILVLFFLLYWGPSVLLNRNLVPEPKPVETWRGKFRTIANFRHVGFYLTIYRPFLRIEILKRVANTIHIYNHNIHPCRHTHTYAQIQYIQTLWYTHTYTCIRRYKNRIIFPDSNKISQNKVTDVSQNLQQVQVVCTCKGLFIICFNLYLVLANNRHTRSFIISILYCFRWHSYFINE